MTALQVLIDEGMIDNAAAQGERFRTGLRQLQQRTPLIREVRVVTVWSQYLEGSHASFPIYQPTSVKVVAPLIPSRLPCKCRSVAWVS